MKKIASILVLIVVVMELSSCVESSKKYKTLQAERDSLEVVATNARKEFESQLATINEIEMALQTIREAENIILMENHEGNTNYAVNQIDAIDRTIKQNKAKIADLEKKLAEAGANSKQLNATITRLKKELNDKDTYINSLRQELSASKAQVAELSGRVENLHQNIKDLNAQNAVQQATIIAQQEAINTVYYRVAPIETLEAEGLASKGGLFSKNSATGSVDNRVMTAADRRELRTLPLNSRKVTILTNHPESSYNLIKDDDKMYSLEIVDPNAFWTISNYLIISIK